MRQDARYAWSETNGYAHGVTLLTLLLNPTQRWFAIVYAGISWLWN